MGRSMADNAKYMGLSGHSLSTAIGLVSGLCFVAFGYGQGDIGGLLVEPSFAKQFTVFDLAMHADDVYQTAERTGAIVASWNLGCLVGALFVVFCGNMLGRRGNAMAGMALEIVGKIVQGCAFTTGQYVAGRVIAGVGNGMIASTIPSWQAECLKTHRRGTLLLVSFGACITFGMTVAFWMVYAFSFAQPSSVCWRAPVLISIIFILPALVIMYFLPESPRWLILKAREEEAMNVLSALNELPRESEDVRREFLMIKHAVKHMSSASITQAFTMGEYRYLHRTLLAVALQVMQQFTGVNLFMQYLAQMFSWQLHFDVHTSMVLAACCATVFFFASLIAVVGIDRFWGRRTLTIFGASGMCVCMVMLCVMNMLGELHGMSSAYIVMAVFLFVYSIFFSIGWQGMSWMWSVELIPLEIRGTANALATAANWLANFAVVQSAPMLFLNTEWRTYIVFAVTNFCIVPIIYYLYPETGGHSLEEVDDVFKRASEKKHPCLEVVSIAKAEPKWDDKYGSYTGSNNGSSQKGDFDNEKWSSSSEEECSDGYRSSRDRKTSDKTRVADYGALPPVITAGHKHSSSDV